MFEGPAVAEFEKIMEEMSDILDTRDLLSHTQWKETNKKPIIETFLIKGMNEAKVRRKRYSATGIYLEAYRLYLVSNELIRFMNDLDCLLDYKPQES